MKYLSLFVVLVGLVSCGRPPSYEYTKTECGVSIPVTSTGAFAEGGANSVEEAQFTSVVTSKLNVVPATLLFTAVNDSQCQFTAIGDVIQ